MTDAPPPVDTLALQKRRGAFFTPPELCRYLVEWAIRGPDDAVLEPSCGEAAFLLAAGRRLNQLGVGPGTLHGVEVHPASAEQARRALAETGHRVRISTDDFFTHAPAPVFDAVVGNPPFVRYQDFTGEARALGQAAALRAGVRLTRLASSWAAFTVHSTLFLKPSGRLALVLPAELLSVNYAVEVRRYLLRRFGRVRLVLFTERIFPGVQAEVVLLLAEGDGGTDHCELQQVQALHGPGGLLAAAGPLASGRVLSSASQPNVGGPVISDWWPNTADGKWTSALLPDPARKLLAGLDGHPALGTLSDWGRTMLGAVTGNNDYFTRSPEQVRAAALDPGQDLVRLSPPGSRHLRGLSFSTESWAALGESGSSNWLFRPSADPSPAGSAYIAAGERLGVPAAYKCRVRTPWWRVPLTPPADLLLTYMNADTPRLIGNDAGVHHLNSVHGVYLHPDTKPLGAELLPLAALNSLTLLGAETVGRTYGGGLLKLEPAEAERLPVPAPSLVARCAPELSGLREQVTDELAAGQLLNAVALVDQVLLSHGLALSDAEIATLTEARAQLAARRTARSQSPR